ncbi:MAG: hypothetical protein JW820_05345 [Spirochaetales bacterium]|nr:hypothetical protein [Spirochaetales bacterium]
MLFRSGELGKLTDSDLAVLVGHEIACVIGLLSHAGTTAAVAMNELGMPGQRLRPLSIFTLCAPVVWNDRSKG